MGERRRAALLAAAAVVILAAGCAPRPTIIWSPAPVSQAIEPNGFRVLAMSFVADTVLHDVALQVSPSLRPYVAISPASLAAVEGGVAKRVRLAVRMPPSAVAGQRVVGWVQIRTGRRALVPAELEVVIAASTPEGTLVSLRLALEERNAAVYAAQFIPERQNVERQNFEHQTDVALDALARTLQTAERISLSADATSAEYRIVLLLGRDRFESTIRLQRDPSGLWRVVRF